MSDEENTGEEKQHHSIYSEEGVEERLEDDEINAAEAGFMQGYDEDAKDDEIKVDDSEDEPEEDTEQEEY